MELQTSANQTSAAAQNNLGILHTSSPAFAGSDTAGAECFRAAAEQGFALAQYNLGLMYEQGRGVRRDALQSRQWLQKAAEQGDAAAQFHLGLNYHRESLQAGHSDPAECRMEALKWLLLAASQGYLNAETSCGNLILIMTYQQLAESNRRVAAFKETSQSEKS